MRTNGAGEVGPRTEALRRALQRVTDKTAAEDLLFLEDWRIGRYRDIAASLRAGQIRRANPTLAAEIDAELTRR